MYGIIGTLLANQANECGVSGSGQEKVQDDFEKPSFQLGFRFPAYNLNMRDLFFLVGILLALGIPRTRTTKGNLCFRKCQHAARIDAPLASIFTVPIP